MISIPKFFIFSVNNVYYESRKRELKTRLGNECRCDQNAVPLHELAEELKTFFDINSPLTASMLGGVAFAALALVGVTSVHAFVGSGGSVVLRWRTVQTLLPRRSLKHEGLISTISTTGMLRWDKVALHKNMIIMQVKAYAKAH